ncbi:hypothetical protein [Shewanella sp.]|uniref:hypothetical protein n=1 Tax=Shewanella sp. TaxID=50422 RepID=UPI003A975096
MTHDEPCSMAPDDKHDLISGTCSHLPLEWLLDGYEAQQRSTLQQWIGSDNQKIIYPKGSREYESQQMINQVELVIAEDASIRILGFPDENLIKVLEK